MVSAPELTFQRTVALGLNRLHPARAPPKSWVQAIAGAYHFLTPMLAVFPVFVTVRLALAAVTMLALIIPGNAQFWGDSWGGRQQPQQRQQPYNPFGGFWGDRPGGFWGDRPRESPRYYPRQRERVREPEREEPPD